MVEIHKTRDGLRLEGLGRPIKRFNKRRYILEYICSSKKVAAGAARKDRKLGRNARVEKLSNKMIERVETITGRQIPKNQYGVFIGGF